MSFNMKKLAALMLVVLLVLSLFPTASFAATDASRKIKATTTDNALGYRHDEFPRSQTLTDAYVRGEVAQTNANDPLPAQYDARTCNYLPAVRNQNPWGTCWAHATIASIEAYMIKHGIVNGETGQPAETSINLSESHLAWFNFTNAYDKLGMLTGDYYAVVKQSAQDNFLSVGGINVMPAATLMRWEGPASETVPALAYDNITTNGLSS